MSMGQGHSKGARSRSATPLGWNNPRVRSFVYQASVLIAVISVVWFFAATAQENLERLNISSGFGFLDNTAGFGIIQTLIPYSEQSSYGRAFLVGLLNTLVVAVIGIVLATLLGFLIGVLRLSNNWLIAKLAAAYVEIMRNIPLLLHLFFWYFAVLRPLPGPADSLNPLPGVLINNRGLILPAPIFDAGIIAFLAAFAVALIGGIFLVRWSRKRQRDTGQLFPAWRVFAALVVVLPGVTWLVAGAPFHLDFAVEGAFDYTGGMRLLPEFVALVLGLTLYTAAFIGEIVRAGIQSVGRGQREAAASLGLKESTTLRLVVIPQALRLIIPPLTSQILNLTKNSSLAVAIAYPDLVAVFSGTVLNQTGQAIEVIAITMAVYLTLSLLTSLAMNWYNARVALQER
ncbi:amino acid ABC transporter permease [Parvibaculum sp.]|jgi:general L-amino acid transport system permease protein|uniref:amino acid ABC transporter permease n=1 Tax=Parvibaculum sp. TaxID=2024848 RepID=UPI000C4AC2EE|nr:amino acid ABC transporter permease [Parvibaculum sp.]MAM93708.1 amino acid ABC transporter permease [Parvibaculum sp.]HCX67695.1 amino acid ABC transporter permease [Rhodobiaceae bacterium]|tara:strand:- start:6969 stop:8171 length:1203 start_codon:yes stop_codon:yes gene_type:complete